MQVGGCQGGIEGIEMAWRGFKKELKGSTGSWSSGGKRVSCKSVVE